ncbi:MAG: hypothetical protein OXF06_08130 [Bacteroidetes bacterium]|nr:hypothetical protein [Bacteroidota bacterium]MCY4224792.1 hypothetical protein [Bacteroidota bacterium]
MRIREQLAQLRDTSLGRRITRVMRIAFTVGVIAFLVWQLREVEFREVFLGLPRNPLFYLLLITLYFLLPAVQFLAYRVVWDFSPAAAIRAFIKKRILNKEVLGYSGEIYLYTWAKDHVQQSGRSLMECIRDMNIISAGASTLSAVILIVFFAWEGQVNIRDLIPGIHSAFLIGAVGVTIVILVIVFKWRRWLFSMPWKATRIIFGLHISRLVVRQVLEISMWHLAMPEVPLEIWFTYAAVSIIINQIPFIPSQDLLTMAIAVSMAGAMTVSEAHIAALFGAVALVNRLINLIFFATLSIQPPKNSDLVSVTKPHLNASKESVS